jgi:CRP-like cAMP-binding protein
MGATASITTRSVGDEESKPKLKVTRKVNSIRVKNLPSPKKRRRPSFFDERQNSDSDDMDLDSFNVDAREDDIMSKATRSILVQAVEEFLTMNGTEIRSNVIDVVVNSMNPLMLQKGQSVITQGEVGSFVYVLESGNVSVVVNGEQIRTMSSGTLFGELALLFDARRSATITCLEKCKLWSLNRSAFKVIQRNATNLAIMQRTRRFQVVPELSVLPSATLAKLVTSLTPMTYKYGDHLYSAGKCSTKIMLIEEGTVEIQVPPALQHMPQQEIERIIGIIRPASYEYKSKSRPSLGNCGSCTVEHSIDVIANIEMTTSFTITEGCVIGMGILLGAVYFWRMSIEFPTFCSYDQVSVIVTWYRSVLCQWRFVCFVSYCFF